MVQDCLVLWTKAWEVGVAERFMSPDFLYIIPADAKYVFK